MKITLYFISFVPLFKNWTTTIVHMTSWKAFYNYQKHNKGLTIREGTNQTNIYMNI
jgi:hypothetical protein